MPFNADTYHANKYRRAAVAYMKDARRMKARGEPPERYRAYVRLARIAMRKARSHDRLKALNAIDLMK